MAASSRRRPNPRLTSRPPPLAAGRTRKFLPHEIRPGMRFAWTRAITAEDIRRFAELSGDRGAHHVRPGPDGRLLAHGLLTATLPTKLGGDMDFIARTMTFEFLRPVFDGDALTCEGVVDSAEARPGRVKTSFSFEVRNQAGEPVLRGSSSGVVYPGGAAAALRRR